MYYYYNHATRKSLAIGDVLVMNFLNVMGHRKFIHVEVASLTPLGVRLLRQEDRDHVGGSYSDSEIHFGWNWNHLVDVEQLYLTEGEPMPGTSLVLCDGRLIEKDAAVLAHNGRYVAATKAVQTEDGFAHERDVVFIDSVAYLKSRLHCVYNNRRTPEYQVEEPDPDCYEYLEHDDCWAHESLVRYCRGDGSTHWVDDCSMWEGDWYSDTWLDDNTFFCDCCEQRLHNDRYGSDGRCEDCDGEEERNRLRSYNDKSAASFRPEKNVPLKFGIELEVESRDANSAVELCESIFPKNYVVYKEDGSLDDEGFEIVTRPDAPEVHKRIFSEFLSSKEVRRTLTSWNSGNCGVHIHVSRAPLSPLWVGRILVMINSPEMRSIVSKVSGRYNTSYAGIRSKKLVDGKKGKDERKYDAVNNSPRDTIEFRLFRGTLVKESFLRYIEFVESVLAFTSPATTGNKDVSSPKKYLDFVSKRRKEYTNLFEFLKVRGFEVSGPSVKPAVK